MKKTEMFHSMSYTNINGNTETNAIDGNITEVNGHRKGRIVKKKYKNGKEVFEKTYKIKRPMSLFTISSHKNGLIQRLKRDFGSKSKKRRQRNKLNSFILL